jgi:L-threonate 2-dehydrogenase
VEGRFEIEIPVMYPKAYQWVAEMREISAFLREDKAAAMIFEGAAQLYDRLATDIANEGQERGTLDEFFRSK